MTTNEDRAFAVGERVRLSIDDSVEGVVTAELSSVGDMRRYRVFHGSGDIGEYYANQLSSFDEDLQAESSPTLETFLASYAARKLTLPSYSSLFSLNAGKIKFIPYQFRPLKKIVKADRPRLLIADEVGVGKTIETGIIIKEFERRESIESIFVVCPKELVPKWQREMRARFDEQFSILDGPTLDYCIREMELEGEWPYQHSKCIAGLEMIRREETANKLMGLEDGLHFDMLVLDEAHHVVNTASNSYTILEYLSDCSGIAVFLSATPIQLRSRDLFVLLNLLLPEDFTSESLFCEMVEPNRYLNEAIRNIRASTKQGWQKRASNALSNVEKSSNWAAARYGGNRQLSYWRNRLLGGALSDEERMCCLRALEDLHSFAHVINRTKRRDIGEFTLREPVTVEIVYSPDEQAFHDAAHEFALAIYSTQHGTLVAWMIMSTIDRLMASCLPAFAGVVDDFTSRGLLSIQGLSDDMDFDIGDIELTGALVEKADELKVLAERLPERDAKTEKLIDIITEALAGDGDGKLLVFSFFKHTLRYLGRNVSEAGVRCAVITGDSPLDERDKLRERFRLPREDPLAIDVLLSSEVGCEGLDYEFCSRMVNYDIPWNPMKIEQRIGRIDRFGQKSPKVRIYNFITQGTVEERIFFRCFERLGIFNSTVGDLEGVLGGVESDLTKIAYDLNLSDEQKAEKAQQGIDNAIRDAEEQREFESNSKELFLVDLATEDDLVGSERSIQMALLQRLLVEFLSGACPSSQFDMVGSGQVRVRMFRSDKDKLLKKLLKLRRMRKVDPISDQYKQLEWYLQSDSQVVTLDFDGSKENSSESTLFVSLSSPLVVMAIDEQPTSTSPQNVTLATSSSVLPKGTYFFACCEWEQKGYKNTTDIEVVLLDGRTGLPVNMDLVDFEVLLLSCETARCDKKPDVAVLDELLYRKQVVEKGRLAEVNDDIITSKLAILDESFSRKISKVHSAAMASKSIKIKTMKERQAQNLQALWDDKRSSLLERRAADIIVRRFATGTIEVM